MAAHILLMMVFPLFSDRWPGEKVPSSWSKKHWLRISLFFCYSWKICNLVYVLFMVFSFCPGCPTSVFFGCFEFSLILRVRRMSRYVTYYFDFTGKHKCTQTCTKTEMGWKHIYEHSRGCNYTCHGNKWLWFVGLYCVFAYVGML